MFRIQDHALSESEIHIFETSAFISPNGFIQFVGQTRKHERGTFNLCEILLEWSIEEQFGIQRIRLGSEKPLTRDLWRRKLLSRVTPTRSLYQSAVRARKLDVSACFPGQTVTFSVMGWRVANVKYWKPGKSVKIEEAKEAKIKRVLVECLDVYSSPRGGKLQ